MGKMEGASTQEGEWPHACLIFNEGAAIGGASLIAPGVLLTAAHLLEIKDGDSITRMTAENLKVRCGEWNLESSDFETHPHQERDVKAITIHPYYSGQKKSTAIQLTNDIAIIHTTEEFVFAPNVNTICLPSFDKPTIKGLCTSMGWGVNSPEADARGVDLMKLLIVKYVKMPSLEAAKYLKVGNSMIVGFVLKHLKRRVQITYYAKEMVVDHWFVKSKDQNSMS